MAGLSYRNSYFLPILLLTLHAKQTYSPWAEQCFTDALAAGIVGENDLAVKSLTSLILGWPAPTDSGSFRLL